METPKVRDHLRKKDILTIPNLISVFRILLIPIIIWLYLGLKNYTLAFVVIVVSGLSDIVDGKIARKFNMISDFGKFLDPVADKLTQGTLILCLISRYKLMIPLIILFVLKEAVMLVSGYILFKRTGIVAQAKWYGKLTTVVLYFVMIVLILFANIPVALANALIIICGVVIASSLVLYLRHYHKLDKNNKLMP